MFERLLMLGSVVLLVGGGAATVVFSSRDAPPAGPVTPDEVRNVIETADLDTVPSPRDSIIARIRKIRELNRRLDSIRPRVESLEAIVFDTVEVPR